jgi:hypothetical protein
MNAHGLPILCWALLLFAIASPAWGYLPVFPGAQGFGTETPAGRGGQIIKVTNLDDSGDGSLRAAIEASGPRIVVFEVGGVIKTTRNLTIRNPYITIAGQTAPSPGVHVFGAGLVVATHNVLVQHLTIRPGDDPVGPDPGNRDAIQIMGQPDYDTYNVVLDHLSASWAIDETISTFFAVRDITISNSIVSEGLHGSLHPKGPHSMGLLLARHSQRISLIGNLLAHHNERMPRIQGELSAAVLNNVMFNVGSSCYSSIGSEHGPTMLSMVGNVFVSGPNTPANVVAIQFRPELGAGSRIFYSDNQAGMVANSAPFNPTVSSAPIWHGSFSPMPASNTETWVLASAGARPADRDPVDRRVVTEVKERSGRIIDGTAQVGGFPMLASTYRPLDIPSNPHGDDNGSGYSNIEEILFQMAAQIEGRLDSLHPTRY